MHIERFTVADRRRMGEALALRIAVFVSEQSVPLEQEIDEHDRDDLTALHVLAREGGCCLGTGRYYERDPASVQIGRMAVEARARGRGVGRAILDALIEHAIGSGYGSAVLWAQTQAREFYAKAGFVAYGELFDDGSGILHQEMRLTFELREP